MQKKCLFISLIISLIFSISCGTRASSKKTVTTGTLFEEMIDLVNLTYFPAPSYRTVQYSSFDRRSNLPGGPGWFANSDGFGKEPIPNFEKVLKEPDEEGIGEYLIADVNGPGAIVRLWSAAISGKIQLFIDNLSTPLYEGPAIDFFHRIYDSFPTSRPSTSTRWECVYMNEEQKSSPFPLKTL
jgi:hypothetical protein